MGCPLWDQVIKRLAAVLGVHSLLLFLTLKNSAAMFWDALWNPQREALERKLLANEQQEIEALIPTGCKEQDPSNNHKS